MEFVESLVGVGKILTRIVGVVMVIQMALEIIVGFLGRLLYDA
jgi:hypothetical protein